MVMAAGKPLELKQPQGGSEATPLYSCVYLFFHFLKFNRQLPLTFMLFISPANIFQKACMEDFKTDTSLQMEETHQTNSKMGFFCMEWNFFNSPETATLVSVPGWTRMASFWSEGVLPGVWMATYAPTDVVSELSMCMSSKSR